MDSITNPLVSVIIPTFNHAVYLKRAIVSVLNQSYKNWELVIVDNYSTDNTSALVECFKSDKIHYLKIRNNGIIAKSRNAGIALCKGDWIAFLDADDWWFPKKLETIKKHFFEYDCVYHDVYRVTDSKNTSFFQRTFSRAPRINMLEDLLCNGNTIVNSSMVVRKKALEKIGLLREDRNINSWEDYDAWLRLAKNACVFKKENSVLGNYWTGGGNISNPSQTLCMIRSFLEVYKYELGNLGISSPPWWCNYASAMSYKALNDSSEASKHFYKAFVTSNSLIAKIKIILREPCVVRKILSVKKPSQD